ncbi:RNA polymerase sigma factor [Cryptosporangium minutisporangium]|uniref:Sigma-70 family RNA polymerase sigma factor n=1 Tax=Cryptosporangium minutisporangium TaxID=113569 RepID=A0ABP6TA21_9ACTN
MAPDEQAFTVFYRRHYGDVERYVRRRLAGDAVRDAVADVFLVAWRRFSEVPPEAALPWLYAVARHTLANEVRGARRAASLRARIEQQPEVHAGDPADRVAGQLALAEVFGALPEISQEIVRLVAWEGLTIAKAATVTGCSVSAATMRLHRARQQAHEALARVAAQSGDCTRPGAPAGERPGAPAAEKKEARS